MEHGQTEGRSAKLTRSNCGLEVPARRGRSTSTWRGCSTEPFEPLLEAQNLGLQQRWVADFTEKQRAAVSQPELARLADHAR